MKLKLTKEEVLVLVIEALKIKFPQYSISTEDELNLYGTIEFELKQEVKIG